MTVPFLDVGAGYRELQQDLDAAYRRVMTSGSYILGDELEAFEHEFASLAQTRHAVGVGNGLDALAIALRAHGVGRGDEVIVPAYTFIATWLAVTRCGASVVPVDVDPGTLVIDPDAAADAITERTAAVVPVHLYGRPAEVGVLKAVADRHDVLLIEDAAQAHGAKLDGRPVGSLGHAAGFSFYPAKNLGAFGDAGALTTDDSAVAQRARRLRNYGSTHRYIFEEMGDNSRLDPLQAAFLRVKLKALERWNGRRAEIANSYLRDLADVEDLVLPSVARPGVEVVWHVFCVRHPRRAELAAYLDEHGIGTLVHYPVPPHLSDAYSTLGFRAGSFPVAETAAATALSLPIGPHLADVDVEAVISAVGPFPRRP